MERDIVMELPSELKKGIPVVHLWGFHKVEIVNYIGIAEFNEHSVTIKVKERSLEVTGSGLTIVCFSESTMLIEGRIKKVQYI